MHTSVFIKDKWASKDMAHEGHHEKHLHFQVPSYCKYLYKHFGHGADFLLLASSNMPSQWKAIRRANIQQAASRKQCTCLPLCSCLVCCQTRCNISSLRQARIPLFLLLSSSSPSILSSLLTVLQVSRWILQHMLSTENVPAICAPAFGS